MRLRQLQSRLARLERQAQEQEDAELQFTIDQKLADRYVELASRLDRISADHKAGQAVDLAKGLAIWKEMNDIRMSNELPQTGVAYRRELIQRRHIFTVRDDDPDYLPLSAREKAYKRQLILLTDIERREILKFPPTEFDNSWTEYEMFSALYRYELDFKNNAPLVSAMWAQFKVKLESYKIKKDVS